MTTTNSTAISDAEITQFADVKPGAVWGWPRNELELEYQSYHDGNFAMLYSAAPTVENGLAVVGGIENIQTPNYFRLCGDFYVDAVGAEPPTLTSTNASRADFITEVRRALLREIGKAVRWRAIKGRGVLMVDSLGIQAVDSSVYFPVTQPGDTDTVTGHIIARPFNSLPDPQSFQSPDRIAVSFFSPEVNEYAVFDFSGNSIGSLLATGPGDIRAIVTFGDGIQDSYFRGGAPLVRELAIRNTIISKVLNRHGAPHMQVPNDAPSPPNINADGSILYRNDKGDGYEYLVFDGKLADQMQAAQRVQDLVYTTFGIPPVVFGVNAGAGESGAARDRLMFSALSRVSRIREDLEEAVPMLLDAMGAPVGDTSVAWAGGPLTTKSERDATTERLYAAGILDRDEARGRLGIVE